MTGAVLARDVPAADTRRANTFKRIAVMAVIAQIVILFVLVPALSSVLRPFYNQNLYADGYDEIAWNLANGNGYRFYPDTAETLLREPGFPLLLAGIFWLFGPGIVAVKAVNLALALATAYVMMRIARKLSPHKGIAFVAPILFLLHPGVLIAESRGGLEMLFALITSLFVLSVYNAIERNTWRAYAVSGVTLGLAVLVKSTPMLFPVFLFLYLAVFKRQRFGIPVIVRNIGVMVAATVLVMSPWIARNYWLTGKIVPTASVLGVSAHAGHYIYSHLSGDNRWVDLDRAAAAERKQIAQTLGYRFKDVTDAYYQYFYFSPDEVAFSSHLLDKVVSEYKHSPGLFVRSVVSNLFNLWFAGKTWKSTMMNVVVQTPYLLLAIAGIVFAFRRGSIAIVAPLLLFIGYTISVHLPILAQARYSVTLIPFISILAAFTLEGIQPWRSVALIQKSTESEAVR